jgi:hypothetical protein
VEATSKNKQQEEEAAHGKTASDIVLERNPDFVRVTTCYSLLALLAAFLAYTSPPKMESVRSSETLVNFY